MLVSDFGKPATMPFSFFSMEGPVFVKARFFPIFSSFFDLFCTFWHSEVAPQFLVMTSCRWTFGTFCPFPIYVMSEMDCTLFRYALIAGASVIFVLDRSIFAST